MKISIGAWITNVLLLAVLVSTVFGVVWIFKLDYEVNLLRSRQLKAMSDEQDGRDELKEMLTKTKFICKLPDDLNAKLDDFQLDVVPDHLKKMLQDAMMVIFTKSVIRDDKVYQIVSKVYPLEEGAKCSYSLGQSYWRPESLNGGVFGRSAIPEGSMVIYGKSSPNAGLRGMGDRSTYIYAGRLALSDLPVSYIKRVIESGDYKKQADDGK